ncbi:ShlB/FhaC/HecB family hemolysin secretion/activation protein [Roseateles sp. L2-2]|uniref:ShlB/FhaC/HecB family hemolysin secretion/activation protein n=1 Tax=Roseateles sp. L2-2 TaxID=3422597 RepID=UPI003D3645EB
MSNPPRLRIEGLRVLDADTVAQHWQAALDRRSDAAAVEAVVRGVERQVRAAGRPFARAYVPADGRTASELRVVVVEGRYGRVDLRGGAAREAAAWFDAVRPGRPIGDELEQQVQALSRLPGVSIDAGLGPGDEVGEGDVDLRVEQAQRWSLDLRADNHGNRYAGRERGSVAGHVNGLLLFGDRLTASAGANSGKGWDGAAAYQVPLGVRGTRVAMTASRHHYELGGEFAALGAQGLVDAVGVMAVVPLTTKGPGRLTWQIGVEGRRMLNEQKAVSLGDSRRAIALTTGLQAVLYPWAGAAAWGGAWMEMGDMRLRDADAAAFDAAGARSAGEYLVLSADAALLRQWGAWGLLLRASGQIADRNLDPSKKFSLGGARSVRAWPLGETSGDHGVLAQMEWRYRWKALEPFGFVDAGRVKFSHTPRTIPAGAKALPQGRMLAGAGLGLRWRHGPWSAEGTAGWRLGSMLQRTSVSDPKARAPQVWVSVTYAL